jgi:hypothetical protein
VENVRVVGIGGEKRLQAPLGQGEIALAPRFDRFREQALGGAGVHLAIHD